MEIDIYAADTNLCLIGEASTRVSAKLIEEVDKDIEKLCKEHPEYLKDKVIKVVYGMQVLPSAVDEARKRGIWLVTANKEVTELMIILNKEISLYIRQCQSYLLGIFWRI
jgi:hypothetical protein